MRGASQALFVKSVQTLRGRKEHADATVSLTLGRGRIEGPWCLALRPARPSKPQSTHGRAGERRPQGAAATTVTAPAEGQQELQDHALGGRQGRPVLHHDAVRRPGRGREARRHGRHPGPAEVRPDAAEADRRLDRRQASRTRCWSRRPTSRPCSAPRSRRPRRGSRSCSSTPRSTTRLMRCRQIASDNEGGGRAASRPSRSCAPRAARSW